MCLPPPQQQDPPNCSRRLDPPKSSSATKRSPPCRRSCRRDPPPLPMPSRVNVVVPPANVRVLPTPRQDLIQRRPLLSHDAPSSWRCRRRAITTLSHPLCACGPWKKAGGGCDVLVGIGQHCEQRSGTMMATVIVNDNGAVRSAPLPHPSTVRPPSSLSTRFHPVWISYTGL
jgi:hypothetical protein